MEQVKRFIAYTIFLYAAIGIVYWIFIQPVYMNWGVTAKEIKMPLPGDELISPNRISSTRAITIQASKEKVWPWIAQIGQNRGGFNSYSWLENLFGANMENTDQIHPEWQNPLPGDTVYYGKNEYYDLITVVRPNDYYSLNGWLFYLQSLDSNKTRLIVRYPSMDVKRGKFSGAFYYGLFEPLHFIMESGIDLFILIISDL